MSLVRHMARAETGIRSSRPAVDGRRAVYRRRRLSAAFACLALLGLPAWVWASAAHAPGTTTPPRSDPAGVPAIRVTNTSGTLTMTVPAVSVAGRRAELLRLLDTGLPQRTVISRGPARITVQLDVPATARAIEASHGRPVRAVGYPVGSVIAAPVVAQQLRNDCEATALSILLATTGVQASQQQLQAEMPRSGPLDPSTGTGGEVWGDPDQGFVGRPDGTGSAGGFGVYPGPVAALATRHGRRLSDMSGASAASIYSRLLEGHAVIAWVALSAGPYGSWTSPQGKPIRVNFGEHTVTLVGLSGTLLRVDDPLTGRLEYWSRSKFEAMWRGLGRRALAA